MSEATAERREEIVRQLRRVGVSSRRIPELADEAEELVRTGEHPGDAVEEILFRHAVTEKMSRQYLL